MIYARVRMISSCSILNTPALTLSRGCPGLEFGGVGFTFRFLCEYDTLIPHPSLDARVHLATLTHNFLYHVLEHSTGTSTVPVRYPSSKTSRKFLPPRVSFLFLSTTFNPKANSYPQNLQMAHITTDRSQG